MQSMFHILCAWNIHGDMILNFIVSFLYNVNTNITTLQKQFEAVSLYFTFYELNIVETVLDNQPVHFLLCVLLILLILCIKIINYTFWNFVM